MNEIVACASIQFSSRLVESAPNWARAASLRFLRVGQDGHRQRPTLEATTEVKETKQSIRAISSFYPLVGGLECRLAAGVNK